MQDQPTSLTPQSFSVSKIWIVGILIISSLSLGGLIWIYKIFGNLVYKTGWGGGMVLFFGVVFILIALWGLSYKVHLDSLHIRVSHWFGEKSINWDEISEVKVVHGEFLGFGYQFITHSQFKLVLMMGFLSRGELIKKVVDTQLEFRGIKAQWL